MPVPERAKLIVDTFGQDLDLQGVIQSIADAAADKAWEIRGQEAKDAAAGLVAALDEYVKTGTSSRRMIAAHQTRHDAVAAIADWNKWANGGE